MKVNGVKVRRRKMSRDMLVFNTIGTVIVFLFAVACLLPFVLVLTGSFTSEKWILTNGYTLFLNKENFSLEGYKIVFKNPDTIMNAYKVTTFVTLVGTVFAIFITTMAGFVLSRPDFPWRNKISFFFFFTTLFSGGLVPSYLMCTQALHFTNHIYALIIPGLFSVWNMVVSKSFMKGIPHELVESAKVDGASEYCIYFKIMMPLCKPLIATLSLFTALGYWNDWYGCMLYINDHEKWNLQYTLQNILNSSEAISRMASQTGLQVASLPSESMKMAMTVVTIGPVIMLYPFLQKYFVKGMTVGSVKG